MTLTLIYIGLETLSFPPAIRTSTLTLSMTAPILTPSLPMSPAHDQDEVTSPPWHLASVPHPTLLTRIGSGPGVSQPPFLSPSTPPPPTPNPGQYVEVFCYMACVFLLALVFLVLNLLWLPWGLLLHLASRAHHGCRPPQRYLVQEDWHKFEAYEQWNIALFVPFIYMGHCLKR